MKTKAAFIVGAGIGYVLGTRAGRRQFESIKTHARDLWNNETVQSTVTNLQDKATEVAKEQGSALKDVAKEQGSALKDKVTDAVKSATSKDSGDSTKDTTSPTPTPSGYGTTGTPGTSGTYSTPGAAESRHAEDGNRP